MTRLAVREIPRSGKPDELLDKFGISARHIVAAVAEVALLAGTLVAEALGKDALFLSTEASDRAQLRQAWEIAMATGEMSEQEFTAFLQRVFGHNDRPVHVGAVKGTLLRLAPLILKPVVYNKGKWRISLLIRDERHVFKEFIE